MPGPSVTDLLASTPVLPLLQADEPELAVRIAEALKDGGLAVVEVVFRTERAAECLRAVSDGLPDVVAGAGTVLNEQQAEVALESGARFIVSPGLDEGVVRVAKAARVPVYPGTITPSEVMRAVNLGLDAVKFFPASTAGGVPALKALASVFRDMKFVPTGGISADNLAEYLGVPQVLACGGSWLTPKADVAAGDFKAISGLAREAVEIAGAARRNNPRS